MPATFAAHNTFPFFPPPSKPSLQDIDAVEALIQGLALYNGGVLMVRLLCYCHRDHALVLFLLRSPASFRMLCEEYPIQRDRCVEPRLCLLSSCNRG